MSKYVKDLVTTHIRKKLDGVQECILVDMTALTANQNNKLRLSLADKNIHVLFVKNSLARRATEGTPLAPGFQSLEGANAIIWGASDIVALAKEVKTVVETPEFSKIKPQGGVLDGQSLDSAQVMEVAKWPSRAEVLSTISGQMLSPGATLSAQLLGPGKKLASQVKKKGEEEGGEGGGDAAPAAE